MAGRGKDIEVRRGSTDFRFGVLVVCTAFLLSCATVQGQEEDGPRVLSKWSDLKGVPGFEDLEGIDDPTMLDDIEDMEDLEQFRGLPGFEALDEDPPIEMNLDLPTWAFETTLAGSLGYKDNILLRPVNGESSAFWRTDLEAMLWRFPDKTTEFVALGGFTDVRYFSAEEVDSEQTAFIHGAWDWFATDWSTVSVPVQMLYQDQVIDMSASISEPLTTQMQILSLSTSPEWSVAAARSFDLAIVGLFRQDQFNESYFDFQDLGGRLRGGYRMGLWGELELTYSYLVRDFDNRIQYSEGGRPLPDTELVVSQQQFEGRFNLKFSPESTWGVKPRASYLAYRDNGSGYFDYDQYRLGLDITWTPGPWRFLLSGSWNHYDYIIQRVYNPDSGNIEQRAKDDFYGQLRIEQPLSTFYRYSSV